MIEAGLIASRFLHFVATITLFGAALFPLYVYGARLERFVPAQKAMEVRLRRLLLAAAYLALASGVGWFIFIAADMAGGITGAFELSTWRAIVQSMTFGPLWIARLAMMLAIAILLMRWPRWIAYKLVPLLAALLLTSLAGTGHTQETEGALGVLHAANDGLHLLGAGVWLGGLWPLGFLLAATSEAERRAAGEALMRFSRIGMVAVATLVASGLVNSWILVGSLEALTSTFYGRVLVAKLGLFAAMVGLAILNRFSITPKFAPASAGSTERWLRRIRRHVLAEQSLGVLVLALVSLLGTLDPAVQA